MKNSLGAGGSFSDAASSAQGLTPAPRCGESCADTAKPKACVNRRRAASVLLKCLKVPKELLVLSESECYYLRGKSGGGACLSQSSQLTNSEEVASAISNQLREPCCPESAPGSSFRAGLPSLPFSRPLQFVAVPLDCARASRRVCQCTSDSVACRRGASASASPKRSSRLWVEGQGPRVGSSSYTCAECGNWRLSAFYPCYFPVDAHSIGQGTVQDVGAFISQVAGCGSVKARVGVDCKLLSSVEERISLASDEEAQLWRGAIRVSPSFSYASNSYLAPPLKLSDNKLQFQVLLECLVHPLGFAPLPRSVYFQHQHFRDVRNPEGLKAKAASKAAASAVAAFLRRADSLVPPPPHLPSSSHPHQDGEQGPPTEAIRTSVSSETSPARRWCELVSPTRAMHFLEWRVSNLEILIPCRVLLAVSACTGSTGASERRERLNVASALQRDLTPRVLHLAPFFERLTDVHFKAEEDSANGSLVNGNPRGPVASTEGPHVKVKTERCDEQGETTPEIGASVVVPPKDFHTADSGVSSLVACNVKSEDFTEREASSPRNKENKPIEALVPEETKEAPSAEPFKIASPPSVFTPSESQAEAEASEEVSHLLVKSKVQAFSSAFSSDQACESTAENTEANNSQRPEEAFHLFGESAKGVSAEKTEDCVVPASSSHASTASRPKPRLLAGLSSSEDESISPPPVIKSPCFKGTASDGETSVSAKVEADERRVTSELSKPGPHCEAPSSQDGPLTSSPEALRLQEEVRRLQEALRLEREARQCEEEAVKERRHAEWLKQRNLELEQEVQRLRKKQNGACKDDDFLLATKRPSSSGQSNKNEKRGTKDKKRRFSRSPSSESLSPDEESCSADEDFRDAEALGLLRSSKSRILDEVEFVTFMACGTTPTETVRIDEKLKRLVKSVKKPPSRVVRRKGDVSLQTAAGAGGPKVVGWPSTPEGWDEVCFLVVADDCQHERLAREAKFLAALVAEVFIVREAAVDFILAHFEYWPEVGSNEHVALDKALSKQVKQIENASGHLFAGVQTQHEMIKHEYRGGKLPKLEDRQELAEDRLFAGHEFYVCGSGREANFIKTLIAIGNGNLVTRGDNCDYVIICDESLAEAKALHKKFARRDEDLVAASHGIKHCSLVTPKFLYDCVLRWALMRPCRRNGHVAFRKAPAVAGARGPRPCA